MGGKAAENSHHKSRHKNLDMLKNYDLGKKDPQNFSTSISEQTSAISSPNPSYQKVLGLTPGETLKKYDDELTVYEKTELSQYDLIYTVGSYRRCDLQEIADYEGYYQT